MSYGPFEIGHHSWAWIDPQGRTHKVAPVQNHAAWALQHIAGVPLHDIDHSGLQLDYDPAEEAQKELMDRGWVAAGNAYNFTFTEDKVSQKALEVCLELVIACARHLGTDPEASLQVWTVDVARDDGGHFSVVGFLERYGGQSWVDKLFKTLLASSIRGAVLARQNEE